MSKNCVGCTRLVVIIALVTLLEWMSLGEYDKDLSRTHRNYRSALFVKAWRMPLYAACSCSLASCPGGETTEESQRFSDPKLQARIGRHTESARSAMPVINAHEAIVFGESSRDFLSRTDNHRIDVYSTYFQRSLCSSRYTENPKRSRVPFLHERCLSILLAYDIV